MISCGVLRHERSGRPHRSQKRAILRGFRGASRRLAGRGARLARRAARAGDGRVSRATGVPHRRVEAWKYTDLAQAIEAPFENSAVRGPLDAALLADPFAASPGSRVDAGRRVSDERLQSCRKASKSSICFELDASTPDWVKTHLGTQAVGSDQPLGALSFALARGGVAIRVQKNIGCGVASGFPQSAARMRSLTRNTRARADRGRRERRAYAAGSAPRRAAGENQLAGESRNRDRSRKERAARITCGCRTLAASTLHMASVGAQAGARCALQADCSWPWARSWRGSI